jgi:hypothetical protein
MNKKFIPFVVLCIVISIIPSVGMIFFPTTTTTENTALKEAPSLTTSDGSFNKLFFQDCGEYFNDHIALRNQMIFTDAKIQTKLFGESNISGVIYGKNDWLYYSSTLDDYSGRNKLSERELFNLAYNLSIVQDYLQKQDINFVFTVPANKNTLYGENMPYYYIASDVEEHNAKQLEKLLEKQNINYISMFDLFEGQNEVLYQLRDSHWNMKGACLAYNSIMDFFNIAHTDYSATEPIVKKIDDGDLNRMLYSFYGELENEYIYSIPEKYNFTEPDASVEDGWLVTENKDGKNTLLMFRDSFADTLIPFMSSEFEVAYYSKAQPNALERYIEADKPDYVVIEKVERNITDYLLNPPIITPALAELPENILVKDTNTSVSVENCEYDANYYTINGEIDDIAISENSEIYVSINDSVYRAYHTSENGFTLYFKKSELKEKSVEIRVYSVSGNKCIQTSFDTINLTK